MGVLGSMEKKRANNAYSCTNKSSTSMYTVDLHSYEQKLFISGKPISQLKGKWACNFRHVSEQQKSYVQSNFKFIA